MTLEECIKYKLSISLYYILYIAICYILYTIYYIMLFSHRVVSDSSVTTGTLASQDALSIGFLRQEYWSVLSFPSSEYLSNPGIKSMSPALAGEFFFIFFWFLVMTHFFFNFFSFIFISWRLITLQYRSGSCHTLT